MWAWLQWVLCVQQLPEKGELFSSNEFLQSVRLNM
jgi:hypothetical protein